MIKKENFIIQKIPSSKVPGIKELFTSVLENHCSNDDNSLLSALADFLQILSNIFPHLYKKQPRFLDTRINNAVLYIEENYWRNITVENLASASNMSVSRFFPAFKKNFGITPVEYLNNYRINRAIIFLINNKEMSVESVSEKCGFDTLQYFSTVFKKHIGISPAAYAKK